MTKKTFLKKLREKLTNLDEHKQDEVIKKYEEIIDDEVKNGANEKDVIASLGDIDLLARIYTKGEKQKEEINEDTKEDYKTSGNIFDQFFDYVDGIYHKIDDQDAKKILLIAAFAVIGIIVVTLLNIPFRIADIVGTSIISLIFSDYYFYEVMNGFWSASIWICYAVLIIWLVINYINRIINRYKDFDIKPLKTNTSSYKANDTKTKEERVSDTRNRVVETSNTALNVVYVILKIFVILLTIPFLLINVGLVVAFIIMITLIASGVFIFGPAIIVLGLIILFGTILDLIYTSISKGGIK